MVISAILAEEHNRTAVAHPSFQEAFSMHLLLSETVHIFSYSPISFLTYFVLGRMLKIRKVGLYALGLTMCHVFFHILYTLAVLYEVPYADVGRTVVQISIDFIITLIVLKKKPGLVILGVSLVLLAAVMAEVVGIATFTALGGIFDSHAMADPFVNPTAYFVMYMVNLTFTALFLIVVWFLWNRIVDKTRPDTVWYFMLFPTSQVVLIALLGIYSDSYNMPVERYLYMIPAAVICIVADIILFRSMRIISQKAVADERALWYEQLLDQQQNYYSYILADQEDAAHIRHDMRNQLQTVTVLMESGEPETARNHLKKLSRLVDRRPSFCCNTVVNALIHVKQLQLSEDSILLTCHCSVPEDLSVSGIDLCSLFSNLLDNAANAVRSLPAEQRRITLSAQVNGEVLTVRCENPYDSDQQPLPAHRPDGHGLGLIILQDLAEKYHGRLETQSNDEIFTATVWIFTDSITDQ